MAVIASATRVFESAVERICIFKTGVEFEPLLDVDQQAGAFTQTEMEAANVHRVVWPSFSTRCLPEPYSGFPVKWNEIIPDDPSHVLHILGEDAHAVGPEVMPASILMQTGKSSLICQLYSPNSSTHLQGSS
ncbi:hypothetical protein D4764_21G0001240 [Takifugu flavidus]|uniref:Uncharacterized protein n=1 Tax=Takifugu flavidus TaxID=433684 RepID=A0A5C6NCL9_9TELE|nr:hypothetical protein D4764_21G0001240 [Takifugu flavidus]